MCQSYEGIQSGTLFGTQCSCMYVIVMTVPVDASVMD